MNTLDLRQAADFLRIHPVTLRIKAAAGEIPGAKVGRAWVFIEVDLVEYLRSRYRARASQGDTLEILKCHSTNAKTHPSGGSDSLCWDNRYNAALELKTR
ncbi:MAG: helix-turn-helix domain-containing protein [bacterium]|nr:helix-turn-helix domain-containing protein [bacterium]